MIDIIRFEGVGDWNHTKHTKEIMNWAEISEYMDLLGFKNRNKQACNLRWSQVLSKDNDSEMTKDEEKYIVEGYSSNKLSFIQIAKKLEKRSSVWVES